MKNQRVEFALSQLAGKLFHHIFPCCHTLTYNAAIQSGEAYGGQEHGRGSHSAISLTDQSVLLYNHRGKHISADKITLNDMNKTSFSFSTERVSIQYCLFKTAGKLSQNSRHSLTWCQNQGLKWGVGWGGDWASADTEPHPSLNPTLQNKLNTLSHYIFHIFILTLGFPL